MNSSKLPPLNLKEDVEKFEALSEKTEIAFQRCKHKQAEYDKDRGEVRCPCGASWTGARLNELLAAFKLDK